MTVGKQPKGVRNVSAIETARRARGLTQAEVARLAGCSRPYVSLVEGGLVPPLRLRAALAAALGKTIEELWPGSTPPAEEPLGARTSSASRSRHGTT
jgi:transcriptional regulator with XRE-family HTH domain